MKRFLFFLLVCLAASSSLFAQKKGDVMYVAVKSVNVKSSTGFFASTKGTLSYGAQVTVRSVSGSKVEVAAGTLTGWVASSALTSKRITVSTASTSASAKEIALAGKGFNEEVEGVYRTENANLDRAYAAIGAVESIVVDDEALKQFIVDGKLAGVEENN
ncbi:MAG: hypothetical protein LBH85_03950 [Treponema sp.]|jgi:uncharacterized protein YgiM (DUF1202 family)|nr:hypothetical protein [Treponema sp.]